MEGPWRRIRAQHLVALALRGNRGPSPCSTSRLKRRRNLLTRRLKSFRGRLAAPGPALQWQTRRAASSDPRRLPRSRRAFPWASRCLRTSHSCPTNPIDSLVRLRRPGPCRSADEPPLARHQRKRSREPNPSSTPSYPTQQWYPSSRARRKRWLKLCTCRGASAIIPSSKSLHRTRRGKRFQRRSPLWRLLWLRLLLLQRPQGPGSAGLPLQPLLEKLGHP
jgi:hypothetical protein